MVCGYVNTSNTRKESENYENYENIPEDFMGISDKTKHVRIVS